MVVPPCPLCGCDDFKPHLFKQGMCMNCKHVHDPKMKAKRVKRKKIKLKKCETCGKTVYRAEMLEALKKVYHTSCFKCVSCKKTLTLITYKVHKNEPYCNPCFGKTDAVSVGFGPGRVGRYESENEGNTTTDGVEGEKTRPPSAADDSDAVKKAIKSSAERRVKETEESDETTKEAEKKIKKKVVRRKSSKKGSGGDVCEICGDRVYATEKLEALGKIYHEMCFKCTTCKKRLTLITYKPWKDDPYCQRCFGQTDGTAHGYGLGAAGNYAEKPKD